jgi:hypothetical protein
MSELWTATWYLDDHEEASAEPRPEIKSVELGR